MPELGGRVDAERLACESMDGLLVDPASADNYVVDIDPSVTGDLRLLVIAAALAVDTALKQDDRGPSLTGLLADRT